jgi:pyruvate/2-oxoglutarate dehydrogenase complex dihydrolipoamide acyltransferase (E2) component
MFQNSLYRMATPTAITLPDVGAGHEPVRIGNWLVDVGDSVEAEDRVVEILLRGITFDVSAPTAGVVTRIDKPIGSLAATGDILGWIESPADPADSEHAPIEL